MITVSKVKKTQKVLHTSLILLFLMTALFPVCEVSARSEEYFTREFEWIYGGYIWTWELNVPHSYYSAYKGVSARDRTKNGISGYSYLVTTEDPYVEMMAQELREVSQKKKWSGRKEIDFVLAFVQCLPYTVDKVTSGYDEYPRFPLESLVDGGGDCEDTSILFATLIIILGYDAVFINPEGHLLVGVSGDFDGWYVEYGPQNTRYFNCETTGEGWGIGELPREFRNKTVNIASIDPDKQFDPRYGRMWYFYSEYIILGGGIVVVILVIAVIRLSSRKKQTPPSPIITPPPIQYCPICGTPASYVQQYQRYYCQRCQKYI